MPEPFTRNRIDLDGGRARRRSWKDLSVLDVKKGDTVAEFGTVAESEPIGCVAWNVRLYNIMGDHKDYTVESRVFAFTLDEESPPESAVESA